jgi:hypothetical protein
MADNAVVVVVGGCFTLLVAGVSYLGAVQTARSNLDGELQKIRAQIKEQEDALERAKIVELSEEYLTPLRYYGKALCDRLGELHAKLQSPDTDEQVRGWFEVIKGQVARNNTRADYQAWYYYEGIFANSTLYYACSYFYYARELRFVRPFNELRPFYSKALDALLTRVTEAFAWNGGGIWATSQEVIGERFRRDGRKLTYAEMCDEHTAEEEYRRAPFYRPIDVFWTGIDHQSLDGIRGALGDLLAFLDNQDPQIGTAGSATDGIR